MVGECLQYRDDGCIFLTCCFCSLLFLAVSAEKFLALFHFSSYCCPRGWIKWKLISTALFLLIACLPLIPKSEACSSCKMNYYTWEWLCSKSFASEYTALNCYIQCPRNIYRYIMENIDCFVWLLLFVVILKWRLRKLIRVFTGDINRSRKYTQSLGKFETCAVYFGEINRYYYPFNKLRGVISEKSRVTRYKCAEVTM